MISDLPKIRDYTVTSLVTEIKALLEKGFNSVIVTGEITNLSSSGAGHWYFNLSDDNSLISCALFRMDALRNPVIKELKEGKKVSCLASLGVYQKRGTFQLIVKKIKLIGEGDLKDRFENLKKKLSNDGLFDLEKKRAISRYPKAIGVVTALKADALSDFIKVSHRRSSHYKIIVSEALVQGDAAPATLVRALHRLIRYSQDVEQLDLIVFCRGGGSAEDLFAFNDEALAYEVAASPVPILSAIGHENDYTIIDYVADKRAETPTAAAMLLTNEMVNLDRIFADLLRRMIFSIEGILTRYQSKLLTCSPESYQSTLNRLIHTYDKKLMELNITSSSDYYLKLPELSRFLDELVERMQRAYSDCARKQNNLVDKLGALLEVLGPKSVLSRGFAIVKSKEGSVISKSAEMICFGKDKVFELNFIDGNVDIRRDL